MTNRNFRVRERGSYKTLKSANANYYFNKNTGRMYSWGKTLEDDAEVFPAPTLLDIEVTTKCTGVNGKVCPFCFPEGTMVDMYDGTEKPIEEIKAGDEVRTYNTKSSNHFGRKGVVKETYVRDYEGELISITLGNDKVIKCTPNHKFLTKRGWVEAQNLLELDVIVNQINIRGIKREQFKSKVYNFACDPFQNYLVEDCVVHNCYKANTPNGENMSFKTFKTILDKFPNVLTQIAFGADATLESNPDLWKMMKYTRYKGYIPNITCAQISEATADNLARYCGAVAISRYDDADACYDSVYKLTSRGMKQVNIHLMISQETYDNAVQTLKDCKTDERLKNLNAVVFLSLKKKGRGIGHHVLTQEQFNSLVELALENNIRIGFDSCSSFKVFTAFSNKPEMKYVKDSIIPCESLLESCYCDVNGNFYPCSFLEGTEGWETGIDVVNCNDFINDIWNNPRTEEFRNALLATTTSETGCSCRICPYYEV